MEAAQLLKQGVSQSEVARRLGVHRQSVIRWARQLAQSGRAGLKQAGRAGRKPKLSARQLRKIEQALRRGPEALGYANGLWTAGRVRELIEDQCGVRYHEAHENLAPARVELPATHRTGAGSSTRRRSGTGSECAGRGLKKSARRAAHHPLHR